jgi:5,10-methylene-tetrahydrofolate dehydrogenase/methenyl tetrahydrofolate cyclohydrolase
MVNTISVQNRKVQEAEARVKQADIVDMVAVGRQVIGVINSRIERLMRSFN